MPRKKVEEKNDENANLVEAFKGLCEATGLSIEVVVDAMSEALKKAYFKHSGDYSDSIIDVNIDVEKGTIEMYKVKNVVEEIQDDVFETDPEEAFEETGVQYKIGDQVRTPIEISAFRRAAAMQAKSVFKQKLREAEKQLIATQYADKVGDVLTGTVESIDEKNCVLRIGHTHAYLQKQYTLSGDHFKIGDTVRVYVEEVDKAATGAPIVVSRTSPRFITRLMEQDISEVGDGIVEIKSISRQPGFRSKVAVYSKDPNIDPSGACLGPRGQRIERVIKQLNGEKIDVVNFSENPLLFIADSLKPAVVLGIAMLDEENKQSRAIVADDQYSLAIGKEAQNVNLAVRLTGWKIDIKSLSEAESEGLEYQLVDDLKYMENAKRARGVVSSSRTSRVDQPTKSFTSQTVEPQDVQVEETTPVVNETPAPVVKEKKVEEPKPIVRPTPTKSKATNMFDELEAALNASSSSSNTESKPTKKKPTKKKEDEEEVAIVETKKQTTPSNVLPVYTEEELREIQEAEEAEEAGKYDDDVDYDEFDEYYDDED